MPLTHTTGGPAYTAAPAALLAALSALTLDPIWLTPQWRTLDTSHVLLYRQQTLLSLKVERLLICMAYKASAGLPVDLVLREQIMPLIQDDPLAIKMLSEEIPYSWLLNAAEWALWDDDLYSSFNLPPVSLISRNSFTSPAG